MRGSHNVAFPPIVNTCFLDLVTGIEDATGIYLVVHGNTPLRTSRNILDTHALVQSIMYRLVGVIEVMPLIYFMRGHYILLYLF